MKYFKVLLTFFIVVVIATTYTTLTAKNGSKIKKKSSPKETTSLQVGDIIFQSSKSGQSYAVQLATGSKYSHVGMIIKDQGELKVIEAVQPVKITSLSQWKKHGDGGHYWVKRLINADSLLTDSVQFNWDYGNGQNSQGITGSTFYGEAGLYDVDLFADYKGCLNDTSLTVFVYPNPEPRFIGDTAIYLGDTAYFSNMTPEADRYLWRFGDGNVANTFDAKHRYDSLKTYNVILRAIKEYPALPNPEDGCSAETGRMITVTRRPKSDYELTVYPNPTTGKLLVNLSLAGEEDVLLILYDVRGREVAKAVYPSRPEGFQTLELNADKVTEGTYILAVIAGNKLIELGGHEPGVVGPFGLRYNNRRKIIIKR